MWCCSFVYVSVENCCHNRASSHFWWLAWQRWCEDTIVAVSESNPRVCSCFSSRWRTPGRGWPTSTGHQPVSGGRWPAADRGLTQPRCESRDTASTCSHRHRPRPLPMVSTGHIVSLEPTEESLFVLEQLPTKVMCCTFGHWDLSEEWWWWSKWSEVCSSSPLSNIDCSSLRIASLLLSDLLNKEWATSPRRIIVISILTSVQTPFLHPSTKMPINNFWLLRILWWSL